MLQSQNIDEAWALLEGALVAAHRHAVPDFSLPRVRLIFKSEQAPVDSHTSDAIAGSLRRARRRKRPLQQLLLLHGKPEKLE